MFWFRETIGDLEVAFTDREGGVSEGGRASLDLGSAGGGVTQDVLANHRRVADELAVDGLGSMSQVHGADVVHLDRLRPGGWGPEGSDPVPVCDATVTDVRGLALLVRVADCVPVLLADVESGLVGAVHAGRQGLVSGVVPAALAELRARGATTLRAWVGPRACGACYELPEEMADAVAAAVPGTRATTSWGTPSVDVGAGVVSQLSAGGVQVHDVGRDACTIEDDTFYSYRRQGEDSGRFGGVVVLR